MIKSLYRDYFQKSRIFLYPALEIKRGVSVTPIETYVSWKDHYSPKEAKLCCLYDLRGDVEFSTFERSKLLGNKLFHDFKQVEGNKGVYVFDFTSQQEDWNNFLLGKYSKFSIEYKKKIKNYIGITSANMPYVDSFLNPEAYFNLYADMMDVDEKVLRDVGELCSLPNLELETLNISVLDLKINQEIS